MKILVTGGTGFLGSRFVESLLQKNYKVVLLTRRKPSRFGPHPYRILHWPLETAEEIAVVQDCDAVINLAGEPIAAARWTDAQKLRIKRSRIQFTEQLLDLLQGSTKLHTVVSASAIGFYGDRKTERLTESSPPGRGFLAEVCRLWEESALRLRRFDLRTVFLRTGIVLDRGGGILAELEPLYKVHLGGPVGRGDQHMSWIHIEDWIRATLFCLENTQVRGPVNLVAPEPVTNKSFSLIYGSLFGNGLQLPAPALALKLVLGEMASMALDSQNVHPEKLLNEGFSFRFPYLREALLHLYDYEEQGRQVRDFYSAVLWLPTPLNDVFAFYSDEKNLERLSPPNLNFRVIKKSTSQITSGTLLDYKLKVHGIPIEWRTQILDWQPPQKFSDTQLKGPYKYWHHTHTFAPLAGGTLIKDKVHYLLPMGALGRLALPIVKKDLRKIFSYRSRVMRNLFVP